MSTLGRSSKSMNMTYSLRSWKASTTDLTTTSTFKWPKYEDSVWVAKGLVLSVLPAPEKVGKSRRSFRFNPDVLQAVIQKFDAWCVKEKRQ